MRSELNADVAVDADAAICLFIVHQSIKFIMALDPKSPDAVRLYVLVGAALAAFLLTYFLVVPSMKNACMWFQSGCTAITVVRGDDNRLWVTAPGSPFTYFFDGHKYIYAYGPQLQGMCPRGVVSGVSAEPQKTQVTSPFCFKWANNPADSSQPAVCVNYNAECAQFPTAYPGTGGTGGGDSTQYSCNGGTTRSPVAACCQEQTLPPERALQCSKAARSSAKADGSLQYTCDNITYSDSSQCCVSTPPCPKTADGRFQQCTKLPQFDWGVGRYTCDGGQTFTDSAECCAGACSPDFVSLEYGGVTDASGDVFEPLFAMDAATMRTVDTDRGVVCGLRRDIASATFEPYRAAHTVSVRFRPPPLTSTSTSKTSGLDAFQIFSVLKARGIFKQPPPQPQPLTQPAK